MLSVYALGRLIWRPVSLILLVPPFLVVAVMTLSQSPVDPDFFFAAGRLRGQIHMLWTGVILVVPLAGFISTYYTSELRRGLFAWTLPGIDEYLFHGLVLLALVFSLPFAAAFAILINPSIAVACLGSGFFWFALGTELQNPLRGSIHRWAVFWAILIVSRGMPGQWHSIASVSPIAFGILAAAAGGFILRGYNSRATARRQAFAMDTAFGLGGAEALRAYWSKIRSDERQWRRALLHGSSRDWAAAAVYETYNPRAGGWARYILVQAALGAVLAYTMNFPSLLVLVAGADFVFVGLQLRMNAIYPISREQRATIFYLASLLENVVTSGLCALFIWLLYSFGPGHLRFLAGDDTFSPEAAAAFAAFVFMLAPVAQWARIDGPPRYLTFAQPHRMGKRFAFQLVFMLLVTSVSFTLRDGNADSWLPWPTVPVVAVVVQVLYWLALQRHFRRADLVSAGP